MADAGVICDKAPVTAAVLRNKIKDRLFVGNTESILLHQTEQCVTGSMISQYAAAMSYAIQ